MADSDSRKLIYKVTEKPRNNNLNYATKKGSQFLESLVFFWCREPESIMMLDMAFRVIGVKMVHVNFYLGIFEPTVLLRLHDTMAVVFLRSGVELPLEMMEDKQLLS